MFSGVNNVFLIILSIHTHTHTYTLTHLYVSCSVSAYWPSGQTYGYTPYTRTLLCLCGASCGVSEHVLSSCLWEKTLLAITSKVLCTIFTAKINNWYGMRCVTPSLIVLPFPHSAHRKSRMSSWTLRCSFSMSFLAKDLLHLSQLWLFTPM